MDKTQYGTEDCRKTVYETVVGQLLFATKPCFQIKVNKQLIDIDGEDKRSNAVHRGTIALCRCSIFAQYSTDYCILEPSRLSPLLTQKIWPEQWSNSHFSDRAKPDKWPVYRVHVLLVANQRL